MSAGQERDQCQVNDIFLTIDNVADILPRSFQFFAQSFDFVCEILGAAIVGGTGIGQRSTLISYYMTATC